MDFKDYAKPSVTVDGVVLTSNIREAENSRKSCTRQLQILLVKRPIEPYAGKWALPGGFMDITEKLEETLSKKLYLKTNISGVYTEQLHVYDNVDRDPRGRVITVAHLVMGSRDKFHDVAPQYGSEVSWFWVEFGPNGPKLFKDSKQAEEITHYDIAFDHNEIIVDALKRLSSLSRSGDLVFHLLPSEFTIRECQDLYEQIEGHTIYSFRRIIEDKVEPTESVKSGAAHRPAKLFRFKGDSGK